MLSIQQNDIVPDWKLGAIVIANSLGMSSAFIINDIEDAQSDALDPDKCAQNVLSSGLLSRRTAMIVFWVTSGLAFALYLLGGLWTTFLGGTGLVMAYMYSAEPFRLKARPVVDIITHALGGGSLQVVIGYVTYDIHFDAAWYVIIAMALGGVYGQFYNQLKDYDVDKLAGLRNTTQSIGKLPARILMYSSIISTGLCLVLAIVQRVFPRWIGTIIAIGSLSCALFVWKTDMRGNRVKGFDTLQIPVLLVMNLTAMIWLAWAMGWILPGNS